ncbi:hypothetical protein BJV74DRAFT_117968 [Russula compacta]|nr:hypothetical protein BJV74DRAFT_117968 [Russula compacta]
MLTSRSTHMLGRSPTRNLSASYRYYHRAIASSGAQPLGSKCIAFPSPRLFHARVAKSEHHLAANAGPASTFCEEGAMPLRPSLIPFCALCCGSPACEALSCGAVRAGISRLSLRPSHGASRRWMITFYPMVFPFYVQLTETWILCVCFLQQWLLIGECLPVIEWMQVSSW